MISTSLIVMIITTILSFVFKYASMRLENDRVKNEMMIKGLNAQAEVTDQARQHKDKGFQYTRRFIAIALTLCVVVIPMVWPVFTSVYLPGFAANFPELAGTTFGYTELQPGFWPFTVDSTETVWRNFNGLVVTPWHTDMFGAVIGMYFGDRMSKTK